jgi:hypothetical protein
MERDFLDAPADLLPDDPAERPAYRAAYRNGMYQTLRELEWVRNQGWQFTERQLVDALMQTMRVYSVAQSGKPIGGKHPAWLRGRVDALRLALRRDPRFTASDSPNA